MNPFFEIDEKIEEYSKNAMQRIRSVFEDIDDITQYNQLKVQKAFIDNSISESQFVSSTGCGYGDRGRETRDRVWALSRISAFLMMKYRFKTASPICPLLLTPLMRV